MSRNQYNILSIDGGGIRGIIPGMVLAEIEKRARKPVCELFDICAGTSTGGILSLGLGLEGQTKGQPKFAAADLVGLYEKRGGDIFKKSFWSLIGSIRENAFSHAGLELVLEQYFGDARLSQSLTQVMATAYDIEGRTTFYFNSRLAKENSNEDFLVREVARCTSAAPTYFEPKLMTIGKNRRAMVDGGVFANNPAMLAYIEAKKQYEWSKQEHQPLVASREAASFAAPEIRQIEEPIFMLSIGTGAVQKPYPYEAAKTWGLVGWVRPIIDILMQGVSETVDYQMKQLLPLRLDGSPRYVRLNINIDAKHSDMSDPGPENIAALKQYAEELIRRESKTLDNICEILGY